MQCDASRRCFVRCFGHTAFAQWPTDGVWSPDPLLATPNQLQFQQCPKSKNSWLLMMARSWKSVNDKSGWSLCNCDREKVQSTIWLWKKCNDER